MTGQGLAVDRRRFRAHPLDGAALYFQPSTGLHVRIANAATATLRRRAPRVVMFGITNACNLACSFCSRDVARPSRWTVATAAAALRGLHDAGTLEVAYGGGEPFAFRGFAELVAELDDTTTLAQHVTTNGTLIDAARWSPFAGRFGQVRLSIYEGQDWRAAAGVLSDHGQRWGANLLVDGAALATLPAALAELAARGCHDVALLSYVGPDRARQLDAAGARRLAEIIADSPVACRLSVCFGDRVAVPRLATGDDATDCGAGRDFVSITPDLRVQSCSFQDRSLPGATAEQILDAWRTQQAALALPSPRAGCARTLPLAEVAPAAPPIAVWQSFSGNNSGESVLVARFHAIRDAEAYLAELAPGWVPKALYSEAWRELFVAEGVLAENFDERGDAGSPRELVAIGATVLAIQSGLDDCFPELRALAWKRGAEVAPGGIHEHGGFSLLVAIRSADARDRDRLLAAPRSPAFQVHVHGEHVVLAAPVLARPFPVMFGRRGADATLTTLGTLAEARDEVVRIAAARPLSADLYLGEISEPDLIHALQRVGHPPPSHPRLWLWWWSDDSRARASSFARDLGDRAIVHRSSVLVDPAPDRKRIAVRAYRRGGHVSSLDGARVALRAMLSHAPPPGRKRAKAPAVDAARVERELRALLHPGTEVATIHEWYPDGAVTATITTDQPAAAIPIVDHVAEALGAQVSLRCEDLDPLGAAVRRVIEGAASLAAR